jgi:hypothetical protein
MDDAGISFDIPSLALSVLSRKSTNKHQFQVAAQVFNKIAQKAKKPHGVSLPLHPSIARGALSIPQFDVGLYFP